MRYPEELYRAVFNKINKTACISLHPVDVNGFTGDFFSEELAGYDVSIEDGELVVVSREQVFHVDNHELEDVGHTRKEGWFTNYNLARAVLSQYLPQSIPHHPFRRSRFG